MATNEERLAASAAWLRSNKDKAQTPEFKRIADVYKTLRTAPPDQAKAPAQQATAEQPQTTLESLAGNFAGGRREYGLWASG